MDSYEKRELLDALRGIKGAISFLTWVIVVLTVLGSCSREAKAAVNTVACQQLVTDAGEVVQACLNEYGQVEFYRKGDWKHAVETRIAESNKAEEAESFAEKVAWSYTLATGGITKHSPAGDSGGDGPADSSGDDVRERLERSLLAKALIERSA